MQAVKVLLYWLARARNGKQTE